MEKIIFSLLAAFLFFQSADAQVDPRIDWKVMEDEHAIWIYDSRHQNLAEQYAKNFRRMLPYLWQMFKEIPDKTTFLISDYTDLPNGSATMFPYPLVVIYPVIPVPHSPIGETDDSFYEILVHEYTHILNMHPVHGGMLPLRWIFGSIVTPNAFLPRWYTEGLATFTESYYTPKGGRLRSQNFEGMVRAMSLSKSWNTYAIDQLNDFQPDWLGGRRAYLLGGALMYEVANTHGLEEIYELNQRYSRRVPYFLNAPAKDRTGFKWPSLLEQSYQTLQKNADDQIRVISSAPVTQGEELAGQGQHNRRPTISPDGKHLVHLASFDDMPSSLHLLNKGDGKSFQAVTPERIATGVDIEHLAWSPDSKRLAFNNTEAYDRFYIYSDIYIYNLDTKKTDRITHGARAGSLAFNDDGKSLYFVQNIPGTKQLVRLNLETKAMEILYTPKLGSNLYGLVVNKGKTIFIEQLLEKRTLKIYDPASNQTKSLNENIATTHLRSVKGGILMTSSRSGVDNLYLVDELVDAGDLSATKTVTNTLTRIFDGDIDPTDKTLYYSEQDNHGVHIKALPFEKWSAGVKAPQVQPLLTLQVPQKIADTENSVEKPLPETENFSGGRYMWPRYWMPFGYVLDGGMGFQASTGAADPLLKNSYSLLAEWDTLTKKTGASFSYVNRSTPVAIEASASQVYRYFYSTDSALRDTSYGLGGGMSLASMWKQWTFNLSWRHSTTELLATEIERSGPTAILAYNSAIQRGYQIAPESGAGFSLMHQSFIKDLGNIGYDKTNISAKYYFSKWLPKRTVLSAQINGTYAPDLRTVPLFTSTIGGNFVTNQLIPPFLVRGYPSGNLLGYNMGAANLEFHFPIAYIYKGWGTFPFFIKNIHGAIIGDTVSLDGLRWSNAINGFNTAREVFGKKWYWGYGAEMHVEATMGYSLPVTLTFGLYRGDNRDVAATDDISYFFNFKF